MLLVTGSRTWEDQKIIWNTLDILYKRGFRTLLHGAAKGVDTIADQWAEYMDHCEYDLTVKRYPVEAHHWEKYGKRAGILRNIAMVDKQPDLVLGFIRNESPGATQCIEYAESKGIETLVFRQTYPILE